MLKQSIVNEERLSITYFIKSSIETVYSAWTDPEKLREWMGPEGVKCEAAEIDLRIGGKYSINMNTTEGERVVEGQYKEIVPNTRLVFTWHWLDGTFKESLVTIDFSEEHDGTLISLVHELLPNKEQSEQHALGWRSCIICLEGYLN